jgi:CheY-like chemotaxis protein
VLERAGYTVLEAATGPEALLRCRQHEGSIDVLLTDVVMPEMSGRELAARFQALYPRAATVFMSGYTADAALRQRALEPGTFFVEKPFTPQTLTGTLREALGSRPHGTPR